MPLWTWMVGFGLIFIFILIAILGTRWTRTARQMTQAIHELQDQVQTLTVGQQRLETHWFSYQNQQHNLLGNLHRTVGQVMGRLEHLERLSQDVQRLQRVLQNPRRGHLVGEMALEAILQDTLPSDYYILQHTFRNGARVDAVVRIGDRWLPIDAKFPLEDFERLVHAESDEDRQRYRRAFAQTVLRHAESIRKKYVVPQEGTLDFAFMFVPAETVYHEIVVGPDDLLGRLQRCQVFPVSPNTLMCYIAVVLRGIQGFQLERRTRELLQFVRGMAQQVEVIRREYGTLYRHIRDAYRKSEDLERHIARFETLFEQFPVSGVSSPGGEGR